MDKLDAMTPAAEAAQTATTGGAVVNGPEGGGLDWQSIDWGQVEDDVRRLRQRIFSACLSRMHRNVHVRF